MIWYDVIILSYIFFNPIAEKTESLPGWKRLLAEAPGSGLKKALG